MTQANRDCYSGLLLVGVDYVGCVTVKETNTAIAYLLFYLLFKWERQLTVSIEALKS